MHLQDNCLALVGSSKASRAVQQAAAAALLQLTRGLAQSLAAVTDPELCRSEYGDAAAAAAEAAATGKPVPLDLTSCLNAPGSTAAGAAGSGPLAGFKEAAKALAAAHAPMLDPSCPNSYPQLPLPELCPDTVWRLPAGALQGAVVDVTAAVASICLQVGGWVVSGCRAVRCVVPNFQDPGLLWLREAWQPFDNSSEVVRLCFSDAARPGCC